MAPLSSTHSFLRTTISAPTQLTEVFSSLSVICVESTCDSKRRYPLSGSVMLGKRPMPFTIPFITTMLRYTPEEQFASQVPLPTEDQFEIVFSPFITGLF